MMIHAFAQKANMVTRNYLQMFGDYHIYENHLEAINEQMKAEIFDMPTLEIAPFEKLEDLTAEHFVFKNYQHSKFISGGKLAV